MSDEPAAAVCAVGGNGEDTVELGNTLGMGAGFRSLVGLGHNECVAALALGGSVRGGRGWAGGEAKEAGGSGGTTSAVLLSMPSRKELIWSRNWSLFCRLSWGRTARRHFTAGHVEPWGDDLQSLTFRSGIFISSSRVDPDVKPIYSH